MNATLHANGHGVPSVLHRYAECGFRLVFFDRGTKGPTVSGWTSRNDAPSEWRGQNVGVFTGTEIAPGKFLADVDFDWPADPRLVLRLLKQTGFAFGRPSKRVGHAFYTTSSPVASAKYDDIDGSCIVELRGTKKDGTIGFQTMVPPSVHPSGEELSAVTGLPAHDDDVARRVRNYAIASLLLKHLGERGLGHEVRLAFAGTLLKLGVAPEDVIAIGEAIAEVAKNDARDVRLAVQSTAEKIKQGGRTKSSRALVDALGELGKDIVERLRRWTQDERTVGADDIVMRGGDLSAIVDRAEAALLAGPIPIYQRGGALIRPVRLDVDTAHSAAVHRSAGTVVLQELRDAWLLEQMGRVLRWLRPSKSGDFAPADPHPIYARTLLARGEWKFPTMRGTVNAPTITRDGRVLDVPGFDAESGLLLDFPSGLFESVPKQPTRDDARTALARLARPLRGFPFVDAGAKSVALSALLTALVRGSLRTAPLHAFDAPTAGTGKSMLAEMAALLATGTRPPAMSQGKSPEEDEKRLSTVLFAGDPVIHIDNCERPVTGDFLCSMLTQEVVQARILGQSERRILPSTALVLASGNNLVLAGDVSRRTVICRLDAGVERPDTREFDFDCHDEVMKDRPSLVVAGLTVLHAYNISERPERLSPMGSFADYEWIRGALVWAGAADPASTRNTLFESDPRTDELIEVMDLWDQVFGKQQVEVGLVSTAAQAETSPLARDLRDKLVEVACRGMWNGRSVGRWLLRHKDRVVGGRSFRCDAGRNGQRWRLVSTGGEARPLPLDAAEGVLR